ncbi:MAG: aminotransferase class I/II-fold pyridoxal phosphate-dependent enzyme [Actinomycetota bacterium]|nr:aminotransferase class I/II-fold pyridoxal phosphate-dependent enzyme [Actinomycetota bacterium]
MTADPVGQLEFRRVGRFPPYVFAVVNELKAAARRAGEDVIDLGMGNPDIPTPDPIVEKLTEAASNPKNHRYSTSRGLPKLRRAICDWYERSYDVMLDPESEALAVIGAKEGLSHLMWILLEPGDSCLVPEPTYPIHTYAPMLAGANVQRVPLHVDADFFEDLASAYENTAPPPRVVIVSFPHNPTTVTVGLDFFERLVDFARQRQVILVHDMAYADLVFDAERAPSLLQVPGAKDVGVEFFSMSKSYSMAGWRLAFMCGNARVVKALGSLKSYLDYGVFQPIQIAGIIALNEVTEAPKQIRETYRGRRDALVSGLARAGWEIPPPPATMFAWAPIPEPFRQMGSLEFSKLLIANGKVAVAPGIGFGKAGDGHVRFALVENEHRIRQATRGIKKVLEAGPPVSAS